jgi:hypothetical protein
MQLFVRDTYPMIATPVQCDVDGISKKSHDARYRRGDRRARIARVAVAVGQQQNRPS